MQVQGRQATQSDQRGYSQVVQESIRRHRKMRDWYEVSDVRACKQKSVGTTIGNAFRGCGMGTYSEYQLHYSADGGGGGDIT
jgi:hypothetical protein